MGTRGAFGFRVDNQDKISYNHWDSYPSGLGSDVASFIRKWCAIHTLDELREKVRVIRLVDEDDTPTSEDIKKLSAYTDLGVGSQSVEDWYCLFREAQGKPEVYIECGMMPSAQSFLTDSLFCEWAYIINLDTEMFEVYQGFQHNPHNDGRYSQLECSSGGYYPVALIREYPLDDIIDMDTLEEELVEEDV